MIRGRLLSRFFHLMGTNLPHLETIDQYIEFIIPRIGYASQGIGNEKNFTNIRWLEISAQDEDTTAILHIFSPELKPDNIKSEKDLSGSLYFYCENGNVTRGVWARIADTSTLILKYKTSSQNVYQLFDLVFLNQDFFIIKKQHNPDEPLVGSKYVFLAREPYIKRSDYAVPWNDAKDYDYVLPWRDVIELLYNIYRLNSTYLLTIVIMIVVVVIIALLSIL